MEGPARSKLNTQVYEEACAWFIECRGADLDAAARARFDRWLRKSPEHLSAYLEITAVWNEGPALDPANKWDLATLVTQAATDPGNVVALSRGQSTGMFGRVGLRRTPMRSPGKALRTTRLGLAAAMAVVLIGALAWLQLSRVPTYAAATGEQLSIVLPDGSTVELNSRSKIRVRYSKAERDVELLAGQALFQVAKDAARPFIVASNGTRVRALGTQFDVYKKHNGTIVTVVEGSVTIQTGPRAADAAGDATARRGTRASAVPVGEDAKSGILLTAGEQLAVTSMSVQRVDHANVASATAWRQRQLVFESASLSEVAEEFNRYNERPLLIDDTALYDFHISGVFSSANPTSLIRFLRERPGVRVIETPAAIRVTKINSSQE